MAECGAIAEGWRERFALRSFVQWKICVSGEDRSSSFAGALMLKREAESAIIHEWMSLPESERLTEGQAAQFALQMKRKYPFNYIAGDTYPEIRRMMLRHQHRIANSSN
jgi:hypothetical protein